MGGLIASCALHETAIVEVPSNSIDFHILRLEKDTLTREDVEECNLSGIQYAVNATLHDTEASLAFDEKCKEVGITVVHAVNLGKQLKSADSSQHETRLRRYSSRPTWRRDFACKP